MVRVSVVLPCFNAEKYLTPALDSILNQTFTDFEVIAIDDASVDSTSNILDSYRKSDSRVCVLTQLDNRGPVAALNAAREVCRGEFVARMDADDVAYSRRLAEQVSFLQEHPETAAVGSWVRMVDGMGRPKQIVEYPEWELIRSSAYATGGFGSSPLCAHPAVMLRRSSLDAVGWYRPAFQHAEDADLWRRLLDRGFQLTNLQEVLLDYRWHGENVSIRTAEAQALSAIRAALSQRMRLAGLDDPFDGLSAAPNGAVVTSWSGFPREVRAPVRVKLVQRLAKRGSEVDAVVLADEVMMTVADIGWEEGLADATWIAFIASLRQGSPRRAVSCLRIALRNDWRNTMRRALTALRAWTPRHE